MPGRTGFKTDKMYFYRPALIIDNFPFLQRPTASKCDYFIN